MGEISPYAMGATDGAIERLGALTSANQAWSVRINRCRLCLRYRANSRARWV